ncbi:MAG: hypothetical protein KAU28_07935, partial [Phycisphaerae bacterium]|nr:hypothetical protein [Phycisphaerae bacterium]
RARQFTEYCRPQIIEQYGPTRGRKIRFIEAVQLSPLGAEVDARGIRKLLPFLTTRALTVPEHVSRSRRVMPPSRKKKS